MVSYVIPVWLVLLEWHILLQDPHFKEDTEKFGYNFFFKWT